MRKTLRIIFILTFYFTSQLTAQSLQWYRTITSAGNEEVYDLATDNMGNVYIAGMIEYEANFGNNVILESVGSHDIFIAKYDSSGNLIWAKRAGGRGGDKVQSIVLDGQGALYITGEFEDTCRWDTIVKMTSGPGVNNMFVARYDTAGHAQWVRNIQTDAHLHTRGYGVASDSQSNVYVSGAVQGNAYFDSTYLFTTAGDYDCMLLKFDRFGNLIWSHRMGGTDSDKSRSIIYDGGSNLYVTGYFAGNADFLGTNLVGRGHSDAFLAKFDTAGTLQWAEVAGDTGFDRGWDVDININGNILMCGDQSRGHFDSNVASCNGRTDGFVAAYDDAGNNLWVTAGGGPEDDECKVVSHDSNGNVYVTGDYGGSAIFPPVSFTGGHFAEVYIASYVMNGSSLRWVRNGVGPLNDRGWGLGLDNSGNIYSTGNFNDALYTGNITIPGDSLYDIFLTRWSPQNICSSMATVTGTIICAGDCDGTAMVSATGLSPFAFTWNTVPVQTGQTAIGLCAGTYSVTVTDSIGCTSSATITLIDPPQLVVFSSTTDITCNGLCNGIADATATGQSPFTYNWNTVPVQTGQSATGLCAGNYSVTVTDLAGCTASTSATFIEPPLLAINSTSTNISCNGTCDGTASANATGNSPFTYSWNTVPLQTTDVINSLCSGSYSVTVTDASGCTSSSSVSLVEPPLLVVNGNETNATCIGCADGSIDLTASGGTGAYQFLWSNGDNTEDLQNLIAGIYTVCVSDLNQCMACDTFIITEPTSGITASGDELHFSLNPNPVGENTTLTLDKTFMAGAHIKLYNVIGELVYEQQIFTFEFLLPLNTLDNGIYFLDVNNLISGHSKMAPIIIQ